MLVIDRELLEEIGLGDLEGDEAEAALAQIRQLLDVRIGLRLADSLPIRRLERLLRDVERHGSIRAYTSLLRSTPDCLVLMQEEARSLRRELDGLAGAIRARGTAGGRGPGR